MHAYQDDVQPSIGVLGQGRPAASSSGVTHPPKTVLPYLSGGSPPVPMENKAAYEYKAAFFPSPFPLVDATHDLPSSFLSGTYPPSLYSYHTAAEPATATSSKYNTGSEDTGGSTEGESPLPLLEDLPEFDEKLHIPEGQSLKDTKKRYEANVVRKQQVRKKIHACEHCEKKFDRPSTLKKHNLVHTGERAFACDTCGRRFSVLSNLNRHNRKCPTLRLPSRTTPQITSALSPTGNAPPSSVTTLTTKPKLYIQTAPRTPAPSPNQTIILKPSPGIPSSSSSSTYQIPSPILATTQTVYTEMSISRRASPPRTPSPPRGRRTRRPPSPQRWLPPSLTGFVLWTELSSTTSTSYTLYATFTTVVVPLPLPPVSPCWPVEERDSFDTTNDHPNPYHPSGWKGRLPGPAIVRCEFSLGRL